MTIADLIWKIIKEYPDQITIVGRAVVLIGFMAVTATNFDANEWFTSGIIVSEGLAEFKLRKWLQ